MEKIGIFGGTFDPIHNGHLEVARQALLQCGLQQVWFMVSPQNPLKKDKEISPFGLRLLMASEAVKDYVRKYPELNGRLLVSDFEDSLPKPSYTIDTLRALDGHMGPRVPVLIAGGDNLRLLDRWREPDAILRDYGLIVYPRDEMPPADVPEGVTVLKDIPLMDISSTEIRRRLAAGETEGLPVADGVIRLWNTFVSRKTPCGRGDLDKS